MKPERDNINQELLVRFINGDMLAFDRVYHSYSHKLYSFIFKILKNEAETEDIVQEVFVKIWSSRASIKDGQSLNCYIFRIAYNSSIDLIRKRTNCNNYLEQLKSSVIIQEFPSVINKMESDELQHQIQTVIAGLPERQKEIFLLHQNGLTYGEIAQHFGISKNTVENHMVKALKYLRQKSNVLRNMFICLFLHLF